jgi:hypothetical protein
MATVADAVDWGLSHILPTAVYSAANRQIEPSNLLTGMISKTDSSGFITLCLRATGLFDKLYIPSSGSSYAYMTACGPLTNVSTSPGVEGIGNKKDIGVQNWERIYKIVEWDRRYFDSSVAAMQYFLPEEGGTILEKGDVLIKYAYAPGQNSGAGQMSFVKEATDEEVILLDAVSNPLIGEPFIGERTRTWDDIVSNYNLAIRFYPTGNPHPSPGPTYLR